MTSSAPEISEPVKSPSLTEAIARFAVDTPGHALPESARHMARLSLLDWIAVAVAGSNEPVSKIVRQMALDEGGAPDASIVGENTRLPARAAAMVNGTASHALDYDDTNFVYIGHPSVAVIPAALAVAEKTGATDTAFIDAALIGMEVASRIGAWLGRSHYEAGFHQTATSGTFGAAMAVARILGLDQKRAQHALGLATTRASGLKSQFGTMGKPFHAGMAAANGVEVATLVPRLFKVWAKRFCLNRCSISSMPAVTAPMPRWKHWDRHAQANSSARRMWTGSRSPFIRAGLAFAISPAPPPVSKRNSVID
jgi:2-methylcitrate dehydratase PrpD